MTKRRGKRGGKRKRKHARTRADPTVARRTPFLETSTGRLTMIAGAIIGLWALVLAIYALSH